MPVLNRYYFLSMIKSLIILSLILLNLNSSAAILNSENPEGVALSQTKEWLRLLHYEKSFLGGYRSRVTGENFFFSKTGKTDPTAEMTETVAAFSKNIVVGNLKQHPQCAFPERYKFLKLHLKLSTIDVACPKLDEYLAKFNPESVTLVFSSAYPHNPGSMFGHTFLKINSKSKDHKKQDLLDWGISYAAQVADNENPLAFVFLGLTGGYRGQFSLLPYYAKVNEYVNNESRDIWEYELNLDREETYRLLRNVWEVETNTYFDYYFLDENCAYQLLAFLEVAKPEWNLLDFPIYVIPGETVKKIATVPGAIKSVKFRPSLQKKMLHAYQLLNLDQRNTFQDLLAHTLTPNGISDSKTLDSLIQYLFYVKKKKDNELNEREKELLRAVLLQRSTLGVSAPDSGEHFISESSRPEAAHHTFRLGVSLGFEQRKFGEVKTESFRELNFKFAFHDLLNSDLGYTPFSHLDFPGITLRYYSKSESLKVENIHGLSLTSLSPLTVLEKHPSFTFHIEVLSPKDLSCDHCQLFHFDMGAGGTLDLGTPHSIIYTLAMAQAEMGSSLPLGYRLLPKLQLGFLSNPVEKYKIQLVSNAVFDALQGDRQKYFFEFQLNQSFFLTRSWDLRLLGQVILNQKDSISFAESRFIVHYYF